MSGLRFGFLTTFYPPYNFGGDGIGVQRLARGLVHAGHHVAVLDGAAELRPGSLTLRRIRELVSEVAAKRRAAGHANLHYLDGLALFGESDVADLPDGLHPNAAGYARIGQRFAERVFGAGGAFAEVGAQAPNTGRPRTNGG